MKSYGEMASVRATAVPRWFGAPDRPLFGWLHHPGGDRARGLVVMCQSMGQEAVFSHYLLRTIADDLATLGFVVVRFDYDGTGDSHGDEHDPDRVAAWLTSIEQAVTLGRQVTDAPLSLFGFRLGALLAVHAAERRDDVHSLLLWDTPRSGRQFLREQVMRQNVSVGRADFASGAFTALGLSLSESTRAELTQLDLRRRRTLPADTVLALNRRGQPGFDAVTDRLGRPVQHLEAADQDDLLSRQALPQDTHRVVVRWLAHTYPHDEHALGPVSDIDATTATAVCLDGVRERATSIGPNGLFGIVVEPELTTPTATVVFVPDSSTPHGGLSRIWTELARQWADAGVRSLRFDLSGCGDSPARDGEPGHTVGVLAHLDDAADAVRHVNPDDPSDTIVIGLCSGGYLSLETGLALRPRAVAVINPVLSFITPEPVADPRRRAIILTRSGLHRVFGRPAGRLAARLSETNQTPAFTTDPNSAWDRAFEACFWQVYLHSVAPWLPDRVWRVINSLATTRGVAGVFGELRAAGTEVLVLAGDPDFDRFLLGARRRVRNLGRRGGLRLEYRRDLDHAIMWPGAKDEVGRTLTGFVLELAGRVTTPDTDAQVIPLRPARPTAPTLDSTASGAW